ncbi:leucine-rich repeat protein [uncultured Methanobrevibacter sp.]|uniref:leucine-rich repeat protein n=1 Tax=uncultured Methanobrevibacter sp. TaxID=253161 RepID=UPI0025E0A9BC|nr:leucine-rich repeat protein [uncultured Methanobrevibacter sp.]
MIKYNLNNINDWNFGEDNIIKVYRNNAVCYYKVTSGDTPVQEPCFAVVDNILQYSETEFEDVFNLANDKWYKLNNLNQYEQYGIYGEGRNITYYDGKLTVDDGYEYMYSGGSWVNLGEVTGGTASLPDVPFTVNYNAKNYNSSTKTLLKTEGQLANVDAVITAGTPTVHDGYLTIATNTRATITGYQTYFNRNSTNPNLTIISKQMTNGSNCHIFANRGSSYNWMYRAYSHMLTLHGTREQGSVSVTTQPVIESVRINSSRLATYNNYTNGTSSTYSNFNYGSTNSRATALFAGYDTSSGEWFAGDFYWIYMSQTTLTDEQVQQVIAYNEGGGGGQTEYPLEYVVREDPPDNLVFSSMEEAEEYECPWYGMSALIAGEDYMFCEGNEWLTKYSYVEVSGEYICDNGDKYKKMQEYDRHADGTLSPSSNYVKGDLIESGSPDCQNICLYNFCGVNANGGDVIINNGTTTLTQSNWTSPYPVEGTVGNATTTIGAYCFQTPKATLSALTIGSTVTIIAHEAFMETTKLTTLTIPSNVTQIDFWAFTRCSGLREVIFEGTTPPTFTNQYSGVFHDYCPPVIYVPDSAVATYRAINGTVWTNKSWSTNIIQPISNRP